MNATSNVSSDTRKFVLALLVDLACDKNYKKCFKAAQRELHHFFYKLKSEDDSKPFVRDILFDTNGNYAHSEGIDELLQEFQLSGVLSRPNPTYKYHDISISASPSADDFKDGLSSEQEDTYKTILDAFKQTLGVLVG